MYGLYISCVFQCFPNCPRGVVEFEHVLCNSFPLNDFIKYGIGYQLLWCEGAAMEDTRGITEAYLYYNATSRDDVKLLCHFEIVIMNVTITQFSQCGI